VVVAVVAAVAGACRASSRGATSALALYCGLEFLRVGFRMGDRGDPALLQRRGFARPLAAAIVTWCHTSLRGEEDLAVVLLLSGVQEARIVSSVARWRETTEEDILTSKRKTTGCAVAQVNEKNEK